MLFTPTADHENGFISLLVQRWHAWRARRDSLSALDSCGSVEVARIARDLSLSPGELRSLAAKEPNSADLVYRRMHQLGLDYDSIARVDQKTLRDMQKTCSLCDRKGRCRQDLACGAPASAWHSYCPNDDVLSALATGGATNARLHKASTWRGDEDRHGLPVLVLGLLLVILASLALLGAPPANRYRDLPGHTPVVPLETVTAPVAAIDCLDASCLSAQQASALHDLRTIQAQGWIASSVDQLASLPRISSIIQEVQAGEALACTRAGGATYYGLMFQPGCTRGGTEAAKLEGFKECRPMSASGVCLLK